MAAEQATGPTCVCCNARTRSATGKPTAIRILIHACTAASLSIAHLTRLVISVVSGLPAGIWEQLQSCWLPTLAYTHH